MQQLPGRAAPPRALPSMQVLHVPDFDYRSSCTLLTDCLGQVAAWSDAHPQHLPITIFLEVRCAEQCREASRRGGAAAAGRRTFLHCDSLKRPCLVVPSQPRLLPLPPLQLKHPDEVNQTLGSLLSAAISAQLAASKVPGPSA